MTTATTTLPHDPSRRRSMGIFSRHSTFTSATPLAKDPTHINKLQPRQRPVSFYGKLSKTQSATLGATESMATRSPDLNAPLPPRPKMSRPNSGFFSKTEMSSSPETSTLSTLSSSTASSFVNDDEKVDFGKSDSNVLFSGEVLSSGLLRSLKRKEYLVLTESHLLRFRSHAKAIESFPQLASMIRTNGRSNTFSSNADLSSDQSLLVLNQIVAVYEFDERYIQVDHVDETTGIPASTILQLATTAEAEQWLRALCKTVRLPGFTTPPFATRTVEFVARRLQQEKDYSPENIMIFRVVQRQSVKNQLKTGGSNDDISKSYSSICYLAVGVNKIHLVPLPKIANSRTSSTLLSPAPLQSFGLLTLCGLSYTDSVDDSFTLKFRSPCRPYQTLHLASSCATQIIQTIRHAADFLRPEWIEPSFTLDIPEKLYNEPFPEIEYSEKHMCFSRTLAAYCAAYEVDMSNIAYDVYENAPDGPKFQLRPPKHRRRLRYSILELLAVFRSLRWNEYFHSISFAGISLDPLKGIQDNHGNDMEAYRTRSGRKLTTKGVKRTLLVLELRALAACSSKLRRMDFADCLEKPRARVHDDESDEEEAGCEIVEAILPLCKRGYFTNIDWIILSGIHLDQADLDWLIDSAVDKTCHFRGFEIARCGLSARSLNLILESLAAQDKTLEGIDISGNPGRLNTSSLNSLGDLLGVFPCLRILRLANLCLASTFGATQNHRNSSSRSNSRPGIGRSKSLNLLSISAPTSRSPSPALSTRPGIARSGSALSVGTFNSARSQDEELSIIPLQTLLTWRLDELDFSGTILNKQTVDALSAYLASESSYSLTKLFLNRCGLRAGELAVLLGCLARENGEVRELHLSVDQLRITPDHNKLVDAIKKGLSPSKLTISNVDYLDEEMFRKLIKALTVNRTLRYLDLSKVFLPSDANADTIKALGDLFANNTTLEVLDISGGYGRIEDGRLGMGLNKAFGSLETNTTLKVLKVEQQRLGPQGAMIIAKMMETNNTLKEIHCSNNHINLQAYTALVNAAERNTSVITLPGLHRDRLEQLEKLRIDLNKSLNDPEPPPSRLSVAHTFSFHNLERKRSMRSLKSFTSRSSTESEKAPGLSEHQVSDALRVLNLRWDEHERRLSEYMMRNSSAKNDTSRIATPIPIFIERA